MLRLPQTTRRVGSGLVLLVLLAALLTACPGGRLNQPPLAIDQELETIESTPISVTLTATDPDGDDLTFAIVVDPNHGALTGTLPDLTYTPDAAYVGTDGFTFTASDGEHTSDEATVAILVTRGNQAPVAQDQELTTPEDTALVITLDASDPDGDGLSFAIGDAPNHGTLSGPPPDVTYLPDHDYFGADAFTFTASDGTLVSDPATVSLEITGVNDPPIALDQSVATDEDTPVPVTLTATDPDGDGLTFAIVATPTHGALAGTPPTLSYAPDTDYVGLDTFTFTASDGVLTSGEATISIDVGGTNDAPTNLALSNASVRENAYPGAQVGTFTTTDPDPADEHTYALVAGVGDDDNADFYLADATLYTDATFDHEATPTKSIRVRTTDLQGATLDAAFTVAVEDVNEPPTAIALSPSSIPENEPAGTVVGTLTTTDPDAGDTHTYSLTSGDGDDDNDRFSVVGDELRTKEGLDHEVTPTLTVRILSQDEGGLGIEQAITIAVEDVNDPPVIVPPADQNVIQNFLSPGSVHVTFAVSDQDGDELAVSATSDNHEIVADADLDLLCGPDTCDLRFVVFREEAAAATISLEVSDGSAANGSAFVVRIAPRLVTTANDDGPGSLRRAVIEAAGGDVIAFDTRGTFATPQTLVLTSGQIHIDAPLLVQGPGQSMLTISAGGASRVFRIGSDILRFHHEATIRDVTVADGNGTPVEIYEPQAYGGAIRVADRAVLERVTIRDSFADEGGGVAIYIRFPLARDPLGTLAVLRDCIVQDNWTAYGGGGVFVWLDGRAEASAVIEDSTIQRNRAHDNFPDSLYGGGIQGGNVRVVDTQILDNFGHGFSGSGEVVRTTISGNQGSGIRSGGGSLTDSVVAGNSSLGPGGGIRASSGEFTVDASTIEGNSAWSGGGVYVGSGSVILQNGAALRENSTDLLGGGALVDGGTLNVEDATISGNTADTGGGIYIGMGTAVLEPASSITQNTAFTDGGGIYNRDGALTGAIEGVNVYDNVPNDIVP